MPHPQRPRCRSYDRIRQILIREWSLTPYEFDRRAAAGEILLQDVISAIECLMAMDTVKGSQVIRYIYREKIEALEAERKQKVQRISELRSYLVMLARVQVTDDNRASIDASKRAAILELEALTHG